MLRRADYLDVAVHAFQQVLNDAQAEANAALFVFERRINLVEDIEDMLLLLFREADAGVANGKAQGDPVVILLFAGDADDDFALVGEFDRISGQVEDNLLQVEGIAMQCHGQVRRDDEDHFELFGRCRQGDVAGSVFQQFLQVEVFLYDRGLSGFQAGEVEDFIDQCEQLAAAATDQVKIFALFAVQRCVLEQVDEADDAVDRRSHLVAHVRQEVAFGSVGGFSLGLALLQLFVHLYLFADI